MTQAVESAPARPQTLPEWRKSVQPQIEAIGRQDPRLAASLSHRLITYDYSAAAREYLLANGIPVPNYLARPRLRGGMFEEEAITLAVTLIKGAITLLIEGNRKSIEKQKDEQYIKATITHPDGTEETGHHEGGRAISDGKRHRKTAGLMKTYTLIPTGAGKFYSKRITYEGNFVDGLFHDPTGEAKYYIDNNQKYTGNFAMGKRHGHGTLELYIATKGEYYIYYRGKWQNDQPHTGRYFAQDGITVIATIEGGKKQATPKQATPKQAAPPSSAPPAKPATTTTTTRAPTRRPPPRRQSTKEIDPSIPPEKACPHIATKLEHPEQDLTLEQSIEVLTTCIAYGAQRAQQLQGKTPLIILGNTGAGKSTFVNAAAGCTMEERAPHELGQVGLDNLIVVRATAEGGTYDEIMVIGHTKKSKTFMPNSATIGKETYVDCPGFLDNRGPEINIANAVNIRAALRNSAGVKIIILINYHSLKADRARGLSEMLKICTDLFGSAQAIAKHKDSLLLGITNIPLNMHLDTLRTWIAHDTPDIMQDLATRLFIYDPLDRLTGPGAWTLARCRQEMQHLPPVENPEKIFRTVLTDSDEKKLHQIGEAIGKQVEAHLKAKEYAQAAKAQKHLQTLSVIDHITIERILAHTTTKIDRHLQTRLATFRDHCHFERFGEAKGIYQELETAKAAFPHDHPLDLQAQKAYYEGAQQRYNDRLEKEAATQRKLDKAKMQIEELIELLEEQKKSTQQELERQQKEYREKQQEMENQIRQIRESYTELQERLTREMEESLRKKDEELKTAKALNQTELQAKLTAERARLQREYDEKLGKVQTEKKQAEAENAARAAAAQRDQKAREDELKKKIDDLEVQKATKKAELQGELPTIAFGATEWERHFGSVGAEPPLPADINRILKSPCPYWPDKKVEETHLLVLVPETVGGKPLTLDRLEKIIQKPRKGHKTTYHHCVSEVKRELGPTLPSHWVLITKDVIPNSTNKTFVEQCKLLEDQYKAPKVLDVATAILMHHVRTGERVYGDNPWTSTRCQERVSDSKALITVGSFSPYGLSFLTGSDVHRLDGDGLGGVRKLDVGVVEDVRDVAVPRSGTAHLGRTSPALPEIAFGAADWEKYFGSVVEEPPLPPDIDRYLKNPCPYTTGKRIEDTHLLVLVPEAVNGQPLTLDLLGEIVQKPRKGRKSKYSTYGKDVQKDLGQKRPSRSHWILITKEQVSSRSGIGGCYNYAEQLEDLKSPYKAPRALDITTAILMHYVKTGEKVYASGRISPCREKASSRDTHVCVGLFRDEGLFVDYFNGNRVLHPRMGGAIKLGSSHMLPSQPLSVLQSTAVRSKPAAERTSPDIPEIAFGAADWNKYFGSVGKEPALPKNIFEILKSPCLYWPDQRVEDTHFLVLVPEKVNGRPFTLDLLGEIIQRPRQGRATGYKRYDPVIKKAIGDRQPSKSHWVLMTKHAIPEKRFGGRIVMCHGNGQYKQPRALDIATVVLMQYVKTGIVVYDKSRGWIASKDSVKDSRYKSDILPDADVFTVLVGGVSSEGLGIACNYDKHSDFRSGERPRWKF